MSMFSMDLKIAVAAVSLLALQVGAVEFTNADKSGDLASPGAWAGGAVPTGLSTHFTNVTGTVTAKADVSFKTGNFVNTVGTAANPIALTFDMRNAATGAEPGPRKVGLWSLDLTNGKHYTVALKGGEWDFNANGSWVTYNHVHMLGTDDTTITSNRVVISDGAVLKNMAPNYQIMGRQRRSSIVLTGQSSFTCGNFFPFDRGKENLIEVRDGSTLNAWNLKFGKGGTSSLVSSNRIVVTGANSHMRIYNSYQDDCCAIGYSKSGDTGCAANILEVKDYATFLARTSSGDNTVQIGMQTPYNEVRVDSGASMAAGNLLVGAGSGASKNLLFVGDEASYSCSESAYAAMKVGCAAGANDNRIVVSNGTLTGKGFLIGNAESSGNAVQIIGPKAKVILPAGNGYSGFFRDGSHDNLVSFSCTTQDWSTVDKGTYRLTIGGLTGTTTERPASNNVFRLAQASQVSVETLHVGWTNGLGTVSNPGNTVEICDTSRILLSNTIAVYPENTLRLKVPEGGYAQKPIESQHFQMHKGSVLDVDMSAWTTGATKCVVFEAPDWTEWIVSINPSVIEAANEKLAGKGRLYWKNRRTLMLKRKVGMSVIIR